MANVYAHTVGKGDRVVVFRGNPPEPVTVLDVHDMAVPGHLTWTVIGPMGPQQVTVRNYQIVEVERD